MEEITAALLGWYDRCARVLPWRGFHDAYRTWVSEAMLQQTRVETVLSYYPRFLERFPTVSSLAEAREDEVLSVPILTSMLSETSLPICFLSVLGCTMATMRVNTE